MISKSVFEFLVKKHPVDKQFRKISELPYVFHCFDTISQLARWGVRHQPTIDGMGMHDVREEDPDTTFDELVVAGGNEAATIAEQLTFIPDEKSDLSKKEQKAIYMSSFGNKLIQSVVCKISDRLCNTRDFVYYDFKYAKKYWKKASDLLKVFHSRKDEIINLYGKDIFYIIDADIDEMDRRFCDL